MFKNAVKLYVYPMRQEAFDRYLTTGGVAAPGAAYGHAFAANVLITAKNVHIPDHLRNLYDHLQENHYIDSIVGFDRDVLEEAGIREADAFIAVSSGDNSNIVSARVALEHYHVPKVIARIFDPRRAEIYERLNIPTVATTTWGVKQFQLMLLHTGKEVRESLGGGELLRVRVPVPSHLVGKPVSTLNVDGHILVAGVSRGGKGFIPSVDSTLQEGDFLIITMGKDYMDELDALLEPAEHH